MRDTGDPARERVPGIALFIRSGLEKGRVISIR
jgi:hypothetical protein